MGQQDVVTQSSNWEERKNTSFFLQKGYPFEEGFPPFYVGKTYTIITRDCRRLLAFVDDSYQYTDGKQWKTVQGEAIYSEVVIAWKEGDWRSPSQPT